MLLLLLCACTEQPQDTAATRVTGDEAALAEQSGADQPASSPIETTAADSAPPTTPQPGQIRPATVQVDGQERQYVVYLPAHLPSDPVSVVVLLHGPTKPSPEVLEAELAKTGLAAVADGEGFVVVLPSVTGETWQVARSQAENQAEVPWVSGFGGAESFFAVGWEYGDDDDRVIMAVLDAVIAEFAVDESKIYSMGVQNGAFMAARVACDHADRFAALAAMTNGVMMTDPCPANRPIPVIGTGGTENPFLSEEQTEEGARLWAEHNGCEPEPATSQIAEGVTELRWNGCDADASVVVHQIADVRYEFIPGPVEEIDGYAPAQAIWRFLSEHALP